MIKSPLSGSEIINFNSTTDNENSGSTTVQDVANLARPYKVYKALLSQSGTDDPVATVLENTLGYEVSFNYSREGVYFSASFFNESNFNPDKIIVYISTPARGDDVFTSVLASLYEDGTLMINTYKYSELVFTNVLSNDVLSDSDNFNKTSIKIEVYP